MPDRDASLIEAEDRSAAEANLDATTEFQAIGAARALPAVAHDRRDQLPGLETERQVTDWGRSERFEGLVDRVLYDFLYHYWFRVDVEGIENIPDEGGALLVAGRSGALPADAAMIAKAVTVSHPRHRPVQLSTEPGLAGIPGVGMIATKLGAVADHPANLHRLLLDEQQLVLTFPEARDGRAPLGRRYVLGRFAAGFTEVAARAGVPIVPVALLGAEEASPVLGRVGRLGSLARLARIPLTVPLPLPAKFRIRFLEAVEVDPAHAAAPGRAPWLADDIRALIQEHVLEMVGARRSVWLG